MRLSASPESEALVASATASVPSADRVAPPQSARGKAVELWAVLTDPETGDLYYESELTGGFVLICLLLCLSCVVHQLNLLCGSETTWDLLPSMTLVSSTVPVASSTPELIVDVPAVPVATEECVAPVKTFDSGPSVTSSAAPAAAVEEPLWEALVDPDTGGSN